MLADVGFEVEGEGGSSGVGLGEGGMGDRRSVCLPRIPGCDWSGTLKEANAGSKAAAGAERR